MQIIYTQIVDHFGDQNKTAKALGVSQASVNAWVNGKASMSVLIALKAQCITENNFLATDLCPSLKQFFKTINVVQLS